MENNVSKGRFLKVFVPVAAVVSVVLAGYFYSELRTLKKDPQALAEKEAAELVEKVGRLVVLPEGEIPTVATVSDPEALKDQAFFKLAQKDDKVLIYPQARKAVLYSVTLNKILDIAPLNIGSSSAANQSSSRSSE